MSNDAAEVAGQSAQHSIESGVFGEEFSVGQWFPHAEHEIPESAGQSPASRVRLARLAFAAVDTWNASSTLLIAELLCVAIAALAGITIATLVHEWFHHWGARFARAHVKIPAKQGLFVFVWDFGGNSTGQFLIMSIAGTIGGLLAVALLWSIVPADSLGRAVLLSAAVASVIYSAMIEWPVIRRCRYSDDPLGELSKIDRALLTRSFIVASLSGIVLTILLIY